MTHSFGVKTEEKVGWVERHAWISLLVGKVKVDLGHRDPHKSSNKQVCKSEGLHKSTKGLMCPDVSASFKFSL